MTATKPRKPTEAECQAAIVAAAKLGGWRETFAHRIGERIQLTDSGCWLWVGELDRRGGYGALAVPTSTPSKWRRVKAHRVVFEIMRGPIPEGLVLDHLCRVHNCVNPDHLEPVTQLVNIMRGHHRLIKAHLKGECVRGHVDDFCRRKDGRVVYCRACRREDRAAKKAQVQQ